MGHSNLNVGWMGWDWMGSLNHLTIRAPQGVANKVKSKPWTSWDVSTLAVMMCELISVALVLNLEYAKVEKVAMLWILNCIIG